MRPSTVPDEIHKIKHVVVIMQENRSFDSYFGTYPGADGFPPAYRRCAQMTRARQRVSGRTTIPNVSNGRAHAVRNAVRDINGGAMDGFVAELAASGKSVQRPVTTRTVLRRGRGIDVMGYHDWHEIPNYWSYARHFVLQDHMFQADASWSLPAHLFAVSGWAAKCAVKRPDASCVDAPRLAGGAAGLRQGQPQAQDPRSTRGRI